MSETALIIFDYWLAVLFFSLKFVSSSADEPAPSVPVNISRNDSIVGIPRWFRWAMKPTGPVRISTSKREESSRMFGDSMDDDSDIASSYGSINS